MTSRSISGTATTSTSPIFRTSTSATAAAVASAFGPAAPVATVSVITSTISVALSIVTIMLPTSFLPIISFIVRITAGSSVMSESRINHSYFMLTMHHLHLAKALVLVDLVSTPSLLIRSFS